MPIKERPILFSGAMVRAILDGRKTQTRRIVKPQPFNWEQPEPCCHETPEGWQGGIDTSLWADQADQHNGEPRRCPYGAIGDRLWVRETLKLAAAIGEEEDSSGGRNAKFVLRGYYAATGRDHSSFPWERKDTRETIPSIHMPRAASRITLEITGVRVERLRDISEMDARAEGIDVDDTIEQPAWVAFFETDDGEQHGGFDAKECFYSVWESINGRGSWKANPWVWVIEFRRVKP